MSFKDYVRESKTQKVETYKGHDIYLYTTDPFPTSVGHDTASQYGTKINGKWQYEDSLKILKSAIDKSLNKESVAFRDYVKEAEGEESTADAGIKIFFTDLNEVAQKQIMDQLMEALNAKPEDSFANKKIMETLGKYPLFVTTGQEISKQLKFDI